MYYKEKEIVQWAEDKGIIQSGDRLTQALKTVEEIAELTANALKDRDMKDDIGDIYVTIVVQANMNGSNIHDLHKNYYDFLSEQNEFSTLKDQIAYMVQDAGMLLAAIQDNSDVTFWLSNIYNGLLCICSETDMILPECIDLAYNEIKGRKGKMVDGVFVKE